MSRILPIIAFAAVVLFIAESSEAQRLGNRRTPVRNTRPAISPYVNLFRGDNGGLNSLYGFYIPRSRTLDFANQTNRELQYQRDLLTRDTLSLQREIQDASQQQQQQQGRGMLQMRPTASASGGVRRQAGTFLNHSNYFPQGGGTARR